MASKVVSIRLGQDLENELDKFSEEAGIPPAAAAKILMRLGLERAQILAAVEAQMTVSALVAHEILSRVIAVVDVTGAGRDAQKVAEERSRQIVSAVLGDEAVDGGED